MLNLALILLAVGFGLMQALIGGARLVYALPCYVVFAIAGLLMLGVPPEKERTGPRAWCVWATVAFAAYVCIRCRFSPVEYLARSDFFMALAALLIYCIVAVHLTGPNERIALLGVLAGYAFFHVLVGAVQFRQGDDFMLLPWIFRPPQYYWRASGFYISPSHLAGLLGLLAMPALAVCCWSRANMATRMLAAYALIVCLSGIAIAGSPENYVSAIVGIAVFTALSLWFVWKVYRDRFVPLLVLAVLSMVMLSTGAWHFVSTSDRFALNAGEVDIPHQVRPLLRDAAWQQARINAVFGTGAGTTLFYARQFRSGKVQSDPIHAHCDYLELLAEYGAVGAGLLAIVLGTHVFSGLVGMRRIMQETRRSKLEKQMSELSLVLGALAAVAVLLVHALTDFSLHTPANTLLVAFLFGILANPGGQLSRRYAPARAAGRWIQLAAPALGAVLLVLSVPRVRGEVHGEVARISLRDGQYAQARDNAERALTAEKKNPNLYYYAGEAHHYLGLEDPDTEGRFQHYRAAADAFSQGLQLFPQDVRLLLKMGRTLDNLGRFDEAGPCFERAVQADPNFGNVYAAYGVHWQLQGQFEKARECYLKAGQLGETRISAVGLRELEQLKEQPLKRRTLNDGLSDFITEPEIMKANEEPVPKVERRPESAAVPGR